VVATAVAVLTLLPVTMPRLRPWYLLTGRKVPAARRKTAPAHRGAGPATPRNGSRPGSYQASATPFAPAPGPLAPGPNGSGRLSHPDPFPAAGPAESTDPLAQPQRPDARPW
jgi:hypothetical protein